MSFWFVAFFGCYVFLLALLVLFVGFVGFGGFGGFGGLLVLLVLLVLFGLVELKSRQVGCYYSPSRIRIDGESVSELPHLFECLAVARIAVDRYDVVVVVLIRVA